MALKYSIRQIRFAWTTSYPSYRGGGRSDEITVELVETWWVLVEESGPDDVDAAREWDPWERALYCDSFDWGAVPRVGNEGVETGINGRLYTESEWCSPGSGRGRYKCVWKEVIPALAIGTLVHTGNIRINYLSADTVRNRKTRYSQLALFVDVGFFLYELSLLFLRRNKKPINTKVSKAKPPSAPAIIRPKGALSFDESTGSFVAKRGVATEDTV